MTPQQILKKIGPSGVIDLYHKTSSPMWFIIDSQEFIVFPDAAKLTKKHFSERGRTKEIGPLTIPGWEVPSLIYGEIYYL